MMRKRGILWFRQDLRLHDNEALLSAIENCDEVMPVYVFDERMWSGKTQWYGLPKTGAFRARFILEAVADLRQKLRALGSDLVIRIGNPEEELFELARAYRSQWIFCNRERMSEEVFVQDALEKNLWAIGQEVRYSRGKLLYHTADLPFPVTHTPDSFFVFRKELERSVPIREPMSAPEELPRIDAVGIESGDMPTLDTFRLIASTHNPPDDDTYRAIGGETAALKRLKHYQHLEGTIAISGDQLQDSGSYTGLSPYLSQGCLSPKYVYHELCRQQMESANHKNTDETYLELLRRDFFRMMGKKHGSKIFLKGHSSAMNPQRSTEDLNRFEQWMNGETGHPFVDANMKQLLHTGFMSYKGRQNVASYLIYDLELNWQMGAEYFESMLVDYDVTSNWCNWQYIAGVGTDTKEHKPLNICSQARRYDPEGEFVRFWLPERAKLLKEWPMKAEQLLEEWR